VGLLYPQLSSYRREGNDPLLKALKMRILQYMLGKMRLIQADICKGVITEK